MLRKLHILIIALVGALAITSCNSDSDTPSILDFSYGDVAVKSFQLYPNDSALANLDSVFFAIDLNNARIYNPDSLPKGTRLTRIAIKPTFTDVSKAEVRHTLDDGTDTTYTYNASNAETDTLNFENGPVYLELTSLDGKNTMKYRIDILVHKEDPDRFAWSRLGFRQIGTPVTTGGFGCTERGDSIFTLYTTTSGYGMTIGSGNGLATWTDMAVTLPEGADPSSLTAADDAFYLLAGRKLWRATDNFSQWTATGVEMDYIYGAAGKEILGNRQESGNWIHVTYPTGVTSPVAAGCPVKGTSQMFTYTTEWSDNAMSMFTGGVAADGSLTGATWAYDGKKWQNVSLTPMEPREGLTIVNYFSSRVSNQWIVTERTLLLAMGGNTADGETATTNYVSYDRGVHWSVAPESLELPDKVKFQAGSRGFTIDCQMTDDQTAIPGWRPLDTGVKAPLQRVSRPVTEWDAPYIYIVDGRSATVWRGAILRYTFKPLQ